VHNLKIVQRDEELKTFHGTTLV